MSTRVTLATAGRVLRQLRHDHRTLALLLAVPSLLLTLLWWIFDERSPQVFDGVGAVLVCLFPFLVMFLVTSIATLRERSSGTLERLFTMPMGKADLLLGYAIGFGLVALLQAGIAVTVAVWPLGLDLAGSPWLLLVIAVADALLGVALGLFVSAFARTEFQAVQFMPVVVLPQFLLGGFLLPREQMPRLLELLSDVLPLSYAIDAARLVTATPDLTAQLGRDLGVVFGVAIALLGLGAATLRRRTP
ncbi:MAG: ABC transporter permease [Sporichthyaceae bacterium]|nr:ABC transporter permease [Sporichthyaceae bacterium]